MFFRPDALYIGSKGARRAPKQRFLIFSCDWKVVRNQSGGTTNQSRNKFPDYSDWLLHKSATCRRQVSVGLTNCGGQRLDRSRFTRWPFWGGGGFKQNAQVQKALFLSAPAALFELVHFVGARRRFPAGGGSNKMHKFEKCAGGKRIF